MKRFIFKLCVFFFLLIITDVALGGIFKLYNYSKGGEIHKIHTIMTKVAPEMLILGSSRASHHYCPDILHNSIDVNDIKFVYNAGKNGNGTVISFGYLLAINQRSFPKYILCEITPEFDISEDHLPDLSILYPYINIDGIKELIEFFDPSEKVKLNSNSYRFNSVLLRLFPSMLKYDIRNDGYEPLYGQMKISQVNKQEYKNFKLSLKKVEILKKFILNAKDNGTKLIFAISPTFGVSEIGIYNEEIKIISQYGVVVLNHLNDDRFINSPEFFQDKVHLNDKGAKLYSKIVAEEINKIIQMNE